MTMPTRHALIGMTLGALCASVLAVTGPGMMVPALAEEILGVAEAPGFDTDNLVKFQERDYTVEHEDWVGTDVLATVRVKKIEGGRVSFVTITTTPTGTYSTDAMFSRHVQYPGISVTALRGGNQFSYWSAGGWQGFTSRIGDSFRYFNVDGYDGFAVRQ